MKKFKVFFLMVFFIVIIPLNVYSESIIEPINICTDAKWAPYAYEDSNNEQKAIGVSVDIISKILLNNQLKFKVKIMPWKRCLLSVKAGKYDVVIDASKNLEREKKFLFSEPVYYINHSFFYEKNKFNNLNIKTNQELNDFKIGGIVGYNFDVYKFDTSKIYQGAKEPKILLAQLRKGRHDLVIGYTEIFEVYEKMGEIDLSGLEWIKIPETSPLVFHMMLTRNVKGKKLLKIVNEGLKKIKSDGIYSNILKKYGITIIDK